MKLKDIMLALWEENLRDLDILTITDIGSGVSIHVMPEEFMKICSNSKHPCTIEVMEDSAYKYSYTLKFGEIKVTTFSEVLL